MAKKAKKGKTKTKSVARKVKAPEFKPEHRLLFTERLDMCEYDPEEGYNSEQGFVATANLKSSKWGPEGNTDIYGDFSVSTGRDKVEHSFYAGSEESFDASIDGLRQLHGLLDEFLERCNAASDELFTETTPKDTTGDYMDGM